MASATEGMEEDEDGGCLIIGLPTMGEEGPPSLLGRPGERVNGGESLSGAAVGGDHGGGGGARPQLFELEDELGGQGSSGLRWIEVSIFDDQVLLMYVCPTCTIFAFCLV